MPGPVTVVVVAGVLVLATLLTQLGFGERRSGLAGQRAALRPDARPTTFPPPSPGSHPLPGGGRRDIEVFRSFALLPGTAPLPISHVAQAQYDAAAAVVVDGTAEPVVVASPWPPFSSDWAETAMPLDGYRGDCLQMRRTVRNPLCLRSAAGCAASDRLLARAGEIEIYWHERAAAAIGNGVEVSPLVLARCNALELASSFVAEDVEEACLDAEPLPRETSPAKAVCEAERRRLREIMMPDVLSHWPRISPHDVWRVLGKERMLVLGGDSIASQLDSHLRCAMMEEGAGSIKISRPGQDGGEQLDLFATVGPNGAVVAKTIHYRYSPALVDALLEIADVIVLNVGLHIRINGPEDEMMYANELRALFGHVREWAKEAGHVFVAQQTPIVNGTRKQIRNEILNAVARELDPDSAWLHILPLYELTKESHHAHLGMIEHRDPAVGTSCDCTHWCYAPALTEAWLGALYPILSAEFS
ncbi:uncharacterized protein AMSG_08264 [Thecamonas trahens ATCC 50062]|uniref:Uncharacterized protein n=1 Tax=Thecamonas trahens ATCC 50062 TaxID=461836 RepID=A0A0L0DIS6_THETB|nr:hypothetical protein AMSG_08264 [Thecamonas trahens ATCC 50062]KNC52011.1 hypothetical protein AMSG_08264 [Thecamonas trahens ATCC 50062]|eukprot:XP_013755594.1 hypothetical protein AMSG_08264 [Thecamonas trahens ATCC 50062]